MERRSDWRAGLSPTAWQLLRKYFVNLLDELGRAKWLLNEAVLRFRLFGASNNTVKESSDIRISRHEQDFGFRVMQHHMACQLSSTKFRHQNIGQDEVNDLRLLTQLHGDITIRGFQHLKSRRMERHRNEPSDAAIVVNEKNSQFLCWPFRCMQLAISG